MKFVEEQIILDGDDASGVNDVSGDDAANASINDLGVVTVKDGLCFRPIAN